MDIHKIKKSTLWIGLSVCLLAALLYIDWRRVNRYVLLNGSGGATYRLDRSTGQTWLIHGTESWLVDNPFASESLQDLPWDEVTQIHG